MPIRRSQKKRSAEPQQKQNHRRPVIDPLVNPGSSAHRHQARSKTDQARPHHRMVTLAQSSPGDRSARAHQSKTATVMLRGFNGVFGRGSWIRTNDLQYPKLPRYQAALYPDYLGNDVDTRLNRCQQGGFRPPQWPLNSGCATWSPGAIPYFFAVPAITSSTPLASPLEAR